MAKPFRFKHFTIEQEHAALKVGTDAMLLGACIPPLSPTPTSILDIGTGTGVIAIMLAQRFQPALLVGIEPDEGSCIDAQLNFSAQSFCTNAHVFPSKIQTYSTNQQFDLIVSNPPYFEGNYLSGNSSKDKARHQLELPFFELIQYTKHFISSVGTAWFILPHHVEEEFISLAESNQLFIKHNITIFGKPTIPKRVILGFSQLKTEVFKEQFTIRNNDGSYTEEYKLKTFDFHGVLL